MNFLKTVADKAKSAVDSLESPSRSISGTKQNGSESSGQLDDGQEGFLCPMCMSRFPGPDQLQQHFQDQHSGEETGESSAAPVVSDNGFTDEEKILLTNQVKALEEAKSLLSSEVNSLRRKLEESLQDGMNGGMDERMLERTNQLAAENVTLKASLDEMTSTNLALEERCQILESERQHRNSVDDASVLKQELISVQKAMDISLQEKEVEFKELLKENNKLKSELEQKSEQIMKESNDSQKSVEAKLSQAEIENERLREELCEKDARLRDLETNCDNLKKNKLAIQQSSQQLQSQLQDESAKHSRLVEELQQVNTSCEAQKNEICQLETKLESEKKEKLSLQTRLESSLEDCDKLKSQCKDLEKSKIDFEETLKRLTGEREELMKQIEEGEGSNLAIQQLTQENNNLQTKLTELQTSLTDKVGEHDQLVTQLKSELTAEKQKSDNLQFEIQRSTRELAKFGEEKKESELATSRLNEELQNKVKLIDDLNKKLSNLDTQLENKNQDVSKLTDSLNKLKDEIVRVQTVRDNKIVELDTAVTEKSVLTARLEEVQMKLTQAEDRLQASRKENEALEEVKEAHESKITEIEQSLLDSKNECEEKDNNMKMLKEAKHILETKIHHMEETNIVLESKQEKLENEVKEVKEREDRLKVDSDLEKNRVQELQTVISATEDKVQEMRAAIEQAMGKERSLLSDLEEKSKTISAIEMEKSTIASSLESKQSTLEVLRKEKEDSEKSLQEEKQERQDLEEQICNLQTKWEVERTKQEEKLEELQTARELLIEQVVQLKESINKSKSEYEAKLQKSESELQKRKEKLESTLQKLQDSSLEYQELKASSEEKQRNLEGEIEDCRGKASDLESRCKLAIEEKNRQEAQLSSAIHDRDAAHSKLLELEAAVGAATEERRGLLERCLAAESETERSRNLTVELRRKMEDSQAALHELGRENQSLQMEVSRQSGRKWKDDSDATNCHSCSGLFSLTNRKHHCRNCGNIFCNNCSGKQTTMEGFKKPQRVCETCFLELANK